MNEPKNIFHHKGKVSRVDRENLNKHKGACLWFTGLSGSGKSTLAIEVESELHKLGIHTFILDGDNIRLGLNKNLTFSEDDRTENIRRIGEVANLFVDAGIVVLSAFISPFIKDRENVRKLLPENMFHEIYVECDLDICEERDPKGLYKKARKGEIKDFTGINSPYEVPPNPEIILNNSINSDLHVNVEKVIKYLVDKNILSS